MTNESGPLKRGHRGRRRGEAVLAAALECFLEHGFAGTSLDLVIERAGGSRRTLYEHFGNKQRLFVAAVEALFARTEISFAAFEQPDLSTDRALVEAGTALLWTLLDPQLLAAFRLVIAEVGNVPELADLFFRDGPGKTYGVFAAYLRRRAGEGALQVDDPQHAAAQLVELIKGDLHLRALLGTRQRPDEAAVRRHVEAAVTTFLRGAVREAGR
jgi:AcrR family transcriptional regulator